jgi:hypothetical protein
VKRNVEHKRTETETINKLLDKCIEEAEKKEDKAKEEANSKNLVSGKICGLNEPEEDKELWFKLDTLRKYNVKDKDDLDRLFLDSKTGFLEDDEKALSVFLREHKDVKKKLDEVATKMGEEYIKSGEKTSILREVNKKKLGKDTLERRQEIEILGLLKEADTNEKKDSKKDEPAKNELAKNETVNVGPKVVQNTLDRKLKEETDKIVEEFDKKKTKIKKLWMILTAMMKVL